MQEPWTVSTIRDKQKKANAAVEKPRMCKASEEHGVVKHHKGVNTLYAAINCFLYYWNQVLSDSCIRFSCTVTYCGITCQNQSLLKAKGEDFLN